MEVSESVGPAAGATSRIGSGRRSAAKTLIRSRIARDLQQRSSADSAIKTVKPLTSSWRTLDPFVLCVHHDDHFPSANKQMGPAASLDDRNIGNDFSGKDGWSMYHGDVVPGFPAHPHIGFEIVTVLRQGTIDHFDSLNATARYGSGDVQWITAGQGMQHSEMFPLLDRRRPNPLELFQIWLNLPHASKRELPNFQMLWRHQIPHKISHDETGRTTEITVVAGELDDAKASTPPPKSWASRADTHVAIWIIKMAPNATWTLPRTEIGVNRTLYFYRGGSLKIEDVSVQSGHVIELEPGCDAHLRNSGEAAQLLFLQGRPIGEPVVARGPFVMSSLDEIQRAVAEYGRTQFGGWPWPSPAPLHPREALRFARYPDGRIERPR
jgi:redox-sensitive bicupin YhaK (pirin superfamily)